MNEVCKESDGFVGRSDICWTCPNEINCLKAPAVNVSLLREANGIKAASDSSWLVHGQIDQILSNFARRESDVLRTLFGCLLTLALSACDDPQPELAQ